MNLGQFRTIEDYFKNLDGTKSGLFPSNDDYVKRYEYVSSTLYTKVHPYVQISATSRDGGHLNDHGPLHIEKVILRASQLIGGADALKLSEYELYILLMAIHIHDIGNIFGRDGHEIRSMDVISAYGIDAGQDRIEWDCIFDIAEAHGGDIKDKISELMEETILGYDVRKPLLAAILKLADELAEDRSRAARFQLKAGQIVPEAELYHKISYSLHSVKIDSTSKSIKLSFDIEEQDLCKKYKKKKRGSDDFEEVYLIDEIYSRTYKTHLEKIYCTRFLRPYIQFDVIRVDIRITLDDSNDRNKRLKRNINYDLEEKGYPSGDNNGIYSICPHLEPAAGSIICEQSKNKEVENVGV